MGGNSSIITQVKVSRLRTDNSVKNHYHSKLRKALRKINKCVADHLKTECRQLKNNLLSRVIQAAEISYTNRDGPKEEARFAFSNSLFT